jgi:hypothetical protein
MARKKRSDILIPITTLRSYALLAAMGRANIHTFTRPLKYGTGTVTLSDGSTQILTTKQEKGIDVRLALDIVRLALDDKYDVALIFSQDQDLSEVANELKSISILQNRWISAFSAFPASTSSTNGRGINRTTWIKIDKTLYDSCTRQKFTRIYQEPVWCQRSH